jgi:hypothetical protein
VKERPVQVSNEPDENLVKVEKIKKKDAWVFLAGKGSSPLFANLTKAK